MGPKIKNLNDLINKNKKKETNKAKANTTEAKEATPAADDNKVEEVKNTPAAKKVNNQGESSEDEVDEITLATKNMSYGNVKEQKDVASSNNKNTDNLVGYGLDEGQEESKDESKQTKQKQGFSGGIAFGRPTFGNKNKVAGAGLKKMDFSAGLDDLDDDTGNVKNDSNTKNQNNQAEGEEQKTGPVRPTFTNSNKGKNKEFQPQSEGGNRQYEFKTVVSEKRQDRDPNDNEGGEARTQKRKQRDHGKRFGEQNSNTNDDDDDFQIVRNTKERKRKQQQQDDDSSDENETQNIRGGNVQRGGNRGRGNNRERGGFARRGQTSNE